MLLHGGGLSWWNYREAAETLQSVYHVILPILDGHAGSDRPFTTIEDNAAEIISFIDRELKGAVTLIGGLSLGAQILLEMLSQRNDLCRCALIESAAVIPSKLTGALIGPSVSASFGLIRNKTFAKMQFRSLRIKPELFGDYFRDTCEIAKPDMTAFLKANTVYRLKSSVRDSTAEMHIFAGEKENRRILRSAEAVREAVPGSRLTILPGLYHGEFSINHPDKYAETVKNILSK
ncbi:MAG: alpha/beta hydrolase [Oscillospiraceae bacterium]|nr:alpha/beta hydrolase [Oscillospiraceae bacterium]